MNAQSRYKSYKCHPWNIELPRNEAAIYTKPFFHISTHASHKQQSTIIEWTTTKYGIDTDSLPGKHTVQWWNYPTASVELTTTNLVIDTKPLAGMLIGARCNPANSILESTWYEVAITTHLSCDKHSVKMHSSFFVWNKQQLKLQPPQWKHDIHMDYCWIYAMRRLYSTHISLDYFLFNCCFFHTHKHWPLNLRDLQLLRPIATAKINRNV